MGGGRMAVVDDQLRVYGIEASGRRRFGDAGGHIDPHQRADDHDRRERGAGLIRRAARAAEPGAVARAA
jgi:hypothetical protein